MSKKKNSARITDPMLMDVRGVFQRRMKNLRLNRGFTQGDLASRTGLSHQRLSHYETGRRMVPITNIRKIAIALNVPQGYLLGDPEGDNAKDCGECVRRLQAKINKLKW